MKLFSLAENAMKLFSLAENAMKLFSLAENAMKLFSLAEDAMKLFSLAEDAMKLFSLAENAIKHVPGVCHLLILQCGSWAIALGLILACLLSQAACCLARQFDCRVPFDQMLRHKLWRIAGSGRSISKRLTPRMIY